MNTVRALALFAVAATVLMAESKKPGDPPRKKRVLVITESKGFVHGVVNRGKGPLVLAERVLMELEGECRAAGAVTLKSGYGAPGPAQLLRRAGFTDCVFLLRRDNV